MISTQCTVSLSITYRRCTITIFCPSVTACPRVIFSEDGLTTEPLLGPFCVLVSFWLRGHRPFDVFFFRKPRYAKKRLEPKPCIALPVWRCHSQLEEPCASERSFIHFAAHLHLFLLSALPPSSRYDLAPGWHKTAASMTAPSSSRNSLLAEEETILRFNHVPSHIEFYERCLIANRPCILPPALIAHWDVVKTKAWARSAVDEGKETSLVDWKGLQLRYGNQTSPVVITKGNKITGETEDERSEMSISQAVDLVLDFESKSDQEKDEDDVQSIYIKDWHLIKQLRAQRDGPREETQREAEEEPYTVPDIFADDWMNNIPVGGEKDVDDFRFVYAGTAGSETLLHRDVYTSYSWSSNVVGKKRWYLFPPRSIPNLRRFPKIETSELIPDIQTLLSTISPQQQEDGQPEAPLPTNTTRKEYPHLEKAWSTVQIIEQNQDETIFIPSNWYHQVLNLTDCISINRNWCNSVNIPSLYQSIVQELDHVQQSLSDVKDLLSSNTHAQDGDGEEWKREFYALVQNVAVQDAGWAWEGFWNMVEFNLQDRAAGDREDLRPKDVWVKNRLLPLVEDFEQREDGRWLQEGIATTARRCEALLQKLG